ncbi:MAG: phosphopyruvate hydratase, partial [Candidatus Andersenbacteria bacterium]|nr:phosphopyruvate hydratase [Candidatus Andersenbacteria bacterium]
MPIITAIRAYEIIASGGTPSMETRVELDDGSVGISSVPFGASAGEYEAVVLFDGDPNRFRGKGMLKAVGNVNTEIAEALVGKDVGELRAIDEVLVALDGTPNKARLGGNAVLSVSLAVARALAHSQRLPVFQLLKEQYQLPERPNRLPYPMMVILEGGRHADNSTDFQEYLVVPEGAPSVHEGV